MQKRDLLAHIAEKSGLLTLFSRRSLLRKHRLLTILAYHRIFKKPVSADDYYDEELLSATQDDFDKQISWLKQYFEIITFEQLGHLRKQSNYLIITFDDGYRDNYQYAYPVLKKHYVPATVFLSTGYTGVNRLFWWDEIARLIKLTEKDEVELNGTKLNLSSYKEKIGSLRHILKYLKIIPDIERKKKITELTYALGSRIKSEPTDRYTLSWDEIKEMSNNGIEFGAHTVNHPILANLDSNNIKYEVEQSKADIEQILNKEVSVFSYPVGGQRSINDEVIKVVKESGFKFAVTYIHGVNQLFHNNPFLLRRLHIEREDNIAVFKAKVLFPGLIKY
jgi:peptidoglycan/xylan/chitin deacetylase (PgdA/CDA1 family)